MRPRLTEPRDALVASVHHDSMADDTDRIQATIDQVAAAGGGTVTLAPRRFTVTRSLVMRTGVTVAGSGMRHTTIELGDRWTVPEGVFVNMSGATDFGIADLRINGKISRRASGQGRGVFFQRASRVQVERVMVVDTFEENLRFDHAVVDGVIANCVLRGGSNGIFLRSLTDDPNNSTDRPPACMRHRILGNRITDSGNSGIVCFNVKDVLIHDNTIEHPLAARGINCSPTTTDVVITRNTVINAHSTGIHVANRSRRILISGNTVRGTIADGSGIGNEGQGIKSYVGCEDIRIVGNVSTHNIHDGIAVMPGGVGITIVGNHCMKNQRDGIRLHAGDGAGVLPPTSNRDLTVASNVCRNNIQSGIHVLSDRAEHGNHDWTVRDNVCVSNRAFGVQIEGNVTGGSVTANLVRDNEDGAVTAPGDVTQADTWVPREGEMVAVVT